MDQLIVARMGVALIPLILSYVSWRYISCSDPSQRRADLLLIVIYVLSRVVLWLVFAIYLQYYVTNSDPRLFYQPMLEHFLAGGVPIREFFYPYGPLLIPTMVPLYLLFGQTLAGISLFAIIAEVLALWFFLKSARILEQRGAIDHSWVRTAMALYILNPATLYYTIFQGYHSVVQTTYSMAALYFLLCGRTTIGYGVGLFSLAGTKLLAMLDWPALLIVRRPQLGKCLVGAVPLVATYIVFQLITGDAFATVRHHINLVSEGNVWYLLTLFGDLRGFYSQMPGSLLPIFSFGGCFVLGVAFWLKTLLRGRAAFSFQAALGMTTFSMSLFFLFSLYTGTYYTPMLMLPASVVVTCPTLRWPRVAIWSLLLISGLSIVGDAMWSRLGQPLVLLDAFRRSAEWDRLVALFLTVSIVIRVACFAILAQLGLRVATTSGVSASSRALGAAAGQDPRDRERLPHVSSAY
jgi:hypothetical protein